MFFTGRMPFLPPNQQRQSTEGKGRHLQCMADTTERSVRGADAALRNITLNNCCYY